MFQHAMDRMKQYTHHCADSLQRFFAIVHEMLEIRLDVRIMLLGT